MKCPNCNETKHEAGAKFCHVCGAKLPEQKKYVYGDLAFTERLKPRQETKHIVITHSQILKPHTIDYIHRLHQKKRGWAGVAYHYFVDKDGDVFIGRPVDTIGAFSKEYNKDSICVCFEGDFTKETLTDKQFDGDARILLMFLEYFYSYSLLFLDELQGYNGSPIRGFRKDFVRKSLASSLEGFEHEREIMFGKAEAATFYDWIDEQLTNFGIPHEQYSY